MTQTVNRAAIPLQEVVNGGLAASSHKYGGCEEVIIPDGTVTVSGEHFDPRREGACLMVGNLAVTVRHPDWRAEEGDPVVHSSDVMVLHGANNTPSSDAYPLVGLEAEGFYLNEDGSSLVIINDDDDHPEAFGDMTEGATPPVRSMREAGELLAQAYLGKIAEAKAHGGLFYPGSNVAHRARTGADINPHAYVRRIVNYMGGNDHVARYYDCASFQVTVGEMFDYTDAASARNLFLTTIAPLTARFTASSFAAQGTIHPRYPGALDNVRPQDGFIQARGLSRRAGSPEGSISEPLTTTKEDFLKRVDNRMRIVRVPGPGRTTTLHGDVRERAEHKPYGATEFLPMDTNGGHIESDMAFADLHRAYMFAMARASKNGDLERLAKRYQRLVGTNITTEDFTRAEANSIALTQDNPNVRVETLDGTNTTPEELWNEAIDMITTLTRGTPFELSRGSQYWLRRRAQEPSENELRPNPNGFTDIGVFYRGGRGTLARYQKTLYRQLRHAGFGEPQAISEVQLRTARAFEQYMLAFNPGRSLAFLKNRNN